MLLLLLEARRLLGEARPTHPFARLCELAYVEALLGNDSAALEEVAARFEEAGYVLCAAEAAAASGNRALAGRLIGLCEGARTPALAEMALVPLTKRERDPRGTRVGPNG